MHSRPQLLSWIMCDAVHIDPGSGKHTILGVFSNINALRFPVSHPHMVWFLTITDCPSGQHKLRISFGPGPTGVKPLLERPFESPGPAQRLNLINEVRGLTFPAPGEYSIIVEIDDEPLLATDLTVSGG
jgi:hypothetical protein